MTYISINKKAGMILDQQDDPGYLWQEISAYWPEDMEYPVIGGGFDKTACASSFYDGDSYMHKYPIETPEDTLASSMYFLISGKDHLSKEALLKVAKQLKDYRTVHNVEIPEDFKEFVKEASYIKDDSVYINNTYNVTTPEDVMRSIEKFASQANNSNDYDELFYTAYALNKAADLHQLDVEVPFTGPISRDFKGALDLRFDIYKATGVDDHILDKVASEMNYILDIANEDVVDILKVAKELKRFDEDNQLDIGWNDWFPDPLNSVMDGVCTDPFRGFEKKANYSNVDWDSLPFDSDIIDAIKEDPESVVPTLPLAQRQMVENMTKG